MCYTVLLDLSARGVGALSLPLLNMPDYIYILKKKMKSLDALLCFACVYTTLLLLLPPLR